MHPGKWRFAGQGKGKRVKGKGMVLPPSPVWVAAHIHIDNPQFVDAYAAGESYRSLALLGMTTYTPFCHPERSEGSGHNDSRMPCAVRTA